MNELITSTHSDVSIDAAGLLASFLSGKNALTLKAYSRDLAHFTKFVGVPELVDAAKLLLVKNQGQANALVLSYKNQIIDEGKAPATINRKLAALKSLVKMARVVGLCSFTLEVSGVEAETLRDTRGPGKEGVDKLLKMVELGTDKKSKRDLAMLHLLYGMALRRGEVCSLNIEHVEKAEGALWILGKSRKQRQRVTMPDKAKEALLGWLEARGSEPGPLFVALDTAAYGKRLTGDGLCRVIKKLGKKAGVSVKPHGLRHAAITRALDVTNGDIRKVRQFSRHKSHDLLIKYDDNRKDFAKEISELVY
jgi:integrase/recombinase XerC